MKSVIIGNGIDIQYGGYAERGNQAILTRAIHNIESDKYTELGWNKDEVKDIFDICVSDAVNIDEFATFISGCSVNFFI